MRCIAIATSYPPDVLADTTPAPHRVVGDYDEFLDATDEGMALMRVSTFR
jgi:hypothetical protein